MPETPNYNYVRPEVTDMLPRWQQVHDCIEGERAVKARDAYYEKPLRMWGEVKKGSYLPLFTTTDTDEAVNRYLAYVQRAVFYPVTGRTHRALVGHCFQKEPTIDLPASLEALRGNVDGAGVSLVQQAKAVLGGVLGFGRGGLYTDYPRTAGPASQAEVKAGRIRPKILRYDPWQIINWRTKTVGALQVPELVVLWEQWERGLDAYAVTLDDRWRILSLDAATGNYRVDVVQRTEDRKGFELGDAPLFPVDSNQQPFKEIPFQFLGAVENDVGVDVPPIEDLAGINIAHYRNSADYEESVFIVGQPTPYAAGLTQDWVEQVLKGTVKLGSRSTVPLPEGGSMGLIQAGPNTMVREAMQAKERQMVALGARLIEQRSVQRTATEIRQEYATEISVLSTCAVNVTAGYLRALEWCDRFAGQSGGVKFQIDPAFELGRLEPAEQQMLISHVQEGGLTWSEYRDKLRQAGIATLDDEAAKAEIDAARAKKAALAPKVVEPPPV